MVKGQGHTYLHERSQEYIFGIGGHMYLLGNKSIGSFGPNILDIFIAGLLQVNNIAFFYCHPKPNISYAKMAPKPSNKVPQSSIPTSCLTMTYY